MINAWTEEGISDNDDYSVLNIRTIYDTNGLETKKLVNIGLGDDAIVNLNIPVDSASPVSFLKKNVLHELKLRNPQLKIHPVEKKFRELYCGFTNDTISIIGKVVVLSSPLRPLLVVKSVYQWNDEHTKAFEELKQQIVNITENNNFDIKRMSRLKTDASHSGLGATL